MSTKNEIEYGFKEVDEDTYVCIADADTRAVMGAKTSRAPNLEKRWEELVASNNGEMWPWGEPPEMVEKFLDKNLKGYMHASIAEMAEVFVHSRNMGWADAWLVEDSPLFVGQEVSTRAVDVLEEDRAPSSYSPLCLAQTHYKWVELFESLRDQAGSKGYKFDDIRWALPGTTRVGVTMCNRVRDGVRQLEMIASLGGPYTELSRRLLEGFKAYAPRATAAVMRGPRKPPSTWVLPVLLKPVGWKPRRDKCVRVKSCAPVTARVPSIQCARDRAGTYLDPAWAFFGAFEIEIECSVAAARDWHRHRAMMPWEIAVPMDSETRELAKSPFYDMSPVSDELWTETSEQFLHIAADKKAVSWAALNALPFGAVVTLRAQGTLPALLYMLELRYSSTGANAEYKEQARQGLFKLASVLGPSIVEREKILGVLSESDRALWERVKKFI